MNEELTVNLNVNNFFIINTLKWKHRLLISTLSVLSDADQENGCGMKQYFFNRDVQTYYTTAYWRLLH